MSGPLNPTILPPSRHTLPMTSPQFHPNAHQPYQQQHPPTPYQTPTTSQPQSPAPDFELDLSKFLQCGLCQHPYSDSDRVPLVLFCGHTFCENCLIPRSNTSEGISCPFCGQISSANVNSLTPNKGVLVVRSDLTVPVEVCQECEQKDASVFCGHCKLNFCQPCSKQVHSLRAFASHAIITVEEKAKVSDVEVCADHDENKKLICLKDHVKLCYLCKEYGGHKNHECVLIKSYTSDMKKKMELLSGSLAHNHSRVMSLLQNLFELDREVSGKYDENKQQIELSFQLLQDALERQKKALLTQLQTSVKEEREKIHSKQGEVSQYAANVEALQYQIDVAMGRSDSYIVENAKRLENEYDAIHKQTHDHAEIISVPTFTLTEKEMDTSQNFITRIGTISSFRSDSLRQVRFTFQEKLKDESDDDSDDSDDSDSDDSSDDSDSEDEKATQQRRPVKPRGPSKPNTPSGSSSSKPQLTPTRAHPPARPNTTTTPKAKVAEREKAATVQQRKGGEGGKAPQKRAAPRNN